MISIIICSRKYDICDELKCNIKNTIGNVKYEIIIIDNSKNQYSIFSAYKEGVCESQYPYLCFMHEDILFKSEKWGDICINQLSRRDDIGMLGVVGGNYINKFSQGWWHSNSRKGEIIQGRIKNGEYDAKLKVYSKDNEMNHEVVAIDGLWMFSKKSYFSSLLSWDTINYSGFHFYDLDISMQVIKAGLKIEIAPVLIEHRSLGNFNSAFWVNYYVFHKKWNDFLPVYTSDLTQSDIDAVDEKMVEYIYKSHLTIINQQRILDKMGYKYFYYLRRFFWKIFKR